MLGCTSKLNWHEEVSHMIEKLEVCGWATESQEKTCTIHTYALLSNTKALVIGLTVEKAWNLILIPRLQHSVTMEPIQMWDLWTITLTTSMSKHYEMKWCYVMLITNKMLAPSVAVSIAICNKCWMKKQFSRSQCNSSNKLGFSEKKLHPCSLTFLFCSLKLKQIKLHTILRNFTGMDFCLRIDLA